MSADKAAAQVEPDDELRPVGEIVAEARDRLRGAAAMRHPLRRLEDELDEVPDPRAAAAEALPAQRQFAWLSIVPSRFADATLADLEGEPFHQRLLEWAANPAGRNLVISGPVGTGKTHAALATCRQRWCDHGVGMSFWPMIELLDALRPGGREGLGDELAHTDDVLVLDDVGAERGSEWTAERVYALINRRWLNQVPLVVTTNLPPTPEAASKMGADPAHTLQSALGERAYSRLADDAVGILLAGDDRRRPRR